MSEVKKKNFIRKKKTEKYKGEFVTNFHLTVSSKALFELSEGAFKLYTLMILNGKNFAPTRKAFAYRMKKSERQISRYYEELKDKGFLVIKGISPKVYKYDFDYNGRMNKKQEDRNKKINGIGTVMEEELLELVETTNDNSSNSKVEYTLDEQLIDKAGEITEYEEFAILENLFWSSNEKTRIEVKQILINRRTKNPEIEEMVEWFLEKTKIM